MLKIENTTKRIFKSVPFRIVIFLTILFLVLNCVFKALRFKFEDGIRPLDVFYKLDDNTVDVLFLGSSRAFININPAILYTEHGIASYVLGGSEQPFWNSYYYLKEALKTQKPDLVVLEGYSLELDIEYSDNSRIIKNNFGLIPSLNMFESLLASVPADEVMYYLFRFDLYHNRYSDLSKTDFYSNYGDVKYNDWHGYLSNFQVNTLEPSNIKLTDETLPLSNKVEVYYRKIIELCLDNHIPLEIIVAPTILYSDDQKRLYNQGAAIAHEYDVNFTDFHDNIDDFHFDYSKDIIDVSHFNYFGGMKFTSYLGDFLVARHNLPDRRGDSRYDSWRREADWFLQTMENYKLQQQETLPEIILSTHSNPSYVCFLSMTNASTERINFLGPVVSDLLATNADVEKNLSAVIEDAIVSVTNDELDENPYYMIGSHSFCLPATGGVFVDSVDTSTDIGDIDIVVYDKITDTIVLDRSFAWQN